MSAVELTGQLFAGVAVEDYWRAIDWYERLFGRSPDVVVREGDEAMWRVSDDGWIYVVRDAGRSGNALVTILVPDLDEYLTVLAARGVDKPEIETEPGKYRKAAFEDPEGNTITIGQSLSASASGS
jgi:catechol 2,3-dioxygenase-like lactoylglutathione lyase family enzyme